MSSSINSHSGSLQSLTGTTSSAMLDASQQYSMDFLFIAIWAAFVALDYTLKPPPFMFWACLGGAIVILTHFFGKPKTNHLVIAAVVPGLVLCTGIGSKGVNHKHTMDLVLMKWDFGISPWVRNVTLPHHVVYQFICYVYLALPLFCILSMMTLDRRGRNILIANLLVAGGMVSFFYWLCPAVGPIHIGDPTAPRNCMPSMHLGWILMFFYSARRYKFLFGLAVFLTAWATLALGEHYILDLIAAAPYVWVVSHMVRKGEELVSSLSPAKSSPISSEPARV